MLQPVAHKIFAMLPVDGQRGWPYLEKRLLLLKVVGSSPLYFAKPEQVILCACANRSIVFHTSLCVIFFPFCFIVPPLVGDVMYYKACFCVCFIAVFFVVMYKKGAGISSLAWKTGNFCL